MRHRLGERGPGHLQRVGQRVAVLRKEGGALGRVQQALAGQPIRVFGDGTQTRSFTWVGDVVRALIGLAGEPRAVGQVVNIGNPEEISMLALAERVKRVTGSASPIELVPYDEAYGPGFEDMRRRVPDIGKIAALIGFRPTVQLNEILARVIEHVRGA